MWMFINTKFHNEGTHMNIEIYILYVFTKTASML
jgi:hypothetical protein